MSTDVLPEPIVDVEILPAEITAPGVYPTLTHEDYHRDPVPGGSLSSTGARRILPPSCPAKFRWEQRNPTLPTKPMKVGTVAHALVLGTDLPLTLVDFDNWRTNAAKKEAADAEARGEIAMLRKEFEPIKAMAEALLQHKLAVKLIEGSQPEASLVWQDAETGVWRRARFDLLRQPSASGRLLIPDYKTSTSANPAKFTKSIVEYGYHQQGPFYIDGAVALNLGDDPAFLFIVQETAAPYLVSVVQLDSLDMRIGAHLNREAIQLYAQCKARDEWPGYCEDIAHVSLPSWYRRDFIDFDI
jgi:hypothetical protein